MNNKKKWIAIAVAVLVITNVFTFALGTVAGNFLPLGRVTLSSAEYKEYELFKKLYTVRDKLYKYYDGSIDDKALVEGAIKGMTAALKDPYTVFMNEKEFKDFTVQAEGTYAGVGIHVGVKDNKIVVVAPIEGSPAKKAGILSGDVIEKVNNVEVNGQNSDQAVSMMRGKAGEVVHLTLNRNGEIKEFDIKRENIVLNTVTGEMLEGNIGYIQISSFDEHTASNFKSKLKELSSKGMKGLILDLRGNPGGLLEKCVEMASNFIEKGKPVVTTIDKYGKKSPYDSIGGDFIGLPMVVLCDGGSASASEVVIGAFRDYKAATTIGEKTFGKGIVQTMLSRKIDGFGDGTALKVTISKYYTPSGENIHGTGIKPDIEVKYPEDLRGKEYNRSVDPQFNKALEVLKSKLK